MFTYQYAQPEAYHFSLDSIHLAEYVAETLKQRSDLQTIRVLDLCAGCGVIGMELSWYLRDLRHVDFVEVQDVYTEYFHKNVTIVNRPELQLNWHLLNYDALLEKTWENTYDLILSNPPYFQPEQGMLSPSSFKNRCRFFLDSSFSNFILALSNSLKPNGHAYFLLRPLKQHGIDLFQQIQQLLQTSTTSAKIITTIRSTDVVLMEKSKY